MDNIFHLAYSFCFCSKDQLNYNKFSEGCENAKNTLILKGLMVIFFPLKILDHGLLGRMNINMMTVVKFLRVAAKFDKYMAKICHIDKY